MEGWQSRKAMERQFWLYLLLVATHGVIKNLTIFSGGSMQHALVDQIAKRFAPLNGVIGDLNVFAGEGFCPQWLDRPWIAMTSSRLGQDPILHREVCLMVRQCLIDCRRRDAILVVAVGSAIEPWAARAAELFQVPMLKIVVSDESKSEMQCCDSTLRIDADISRDEAVILVADRVDAVYVRRTGLIEHALLRRLELFSDTSTRVAIMSHRESIAKKCAGKNLVAKGAIGWWAGRGESAPIEKGDSTLGQLVNGGWIHSENEWLVHCTRSCVGPWPGQTEHQYRDALLLGEVDANRTPLDTLRRIIRSKKLIANAIASAKKWPVVCFSSAPLADRLLSRCYRPHLKRWDYEPYGIAIRRKTAERLGFRSVIYGDKQDRASIDASDQYRFQAIGKTYDWTAEREWRYNSDIDLQTLDVKDVRVFVATDHDAKEIQSASPWQISVCLEPPPNDAERV